jgi:hypothetical protein
MPKSVHDFIVSRHDRKPKVVWGELRASTIEQPIHPRIHDPLISAIQHKQFVTLTLKGAQRGIRRAAHLGPSR